MSRKRTVYAFLLLAAAVSAVALAEEEHSWTWSDNQVAGVWTLKENWSPAWDPWDPGPPNQQVLIHVDNTQDGFKTCIYGVDDLHKYVIKSLYIKNGNEVCHTGGTLEIHGSGAGTSGLYLGGDEANFSEGFYTMTGGTLAVTGVSSPDNIVGVGYWSDGEPQESAGTFDQQGGTCTFDNLYIRSSYDQNSYYYLRKTGEAASTLTVKGGTSPQWPIGVDVGYRCVFTQSANTTHTLTNFGLEVGGQYVMSGGELTIGQNSYGPLEVADANLQVWGRFDQHGTGIITVLQQDAEPNAGGALNITGGYYTLNSSAGGTVLTAEAGITVSNGGRFEWLAGGIDAPFIHLSSSSTLSTLALGFQEGETAEFDLDNILGGVSTPEVTGLSDSTLEIINDATAVSSALVSPKYLNIGSSYSDTNQGTGGYEISGTLSGKALQADQIRVGILTAGTLTLDADGFSAEAIQTGSMFLGTAASGLLDVEQSAEIKLTNSTSFTIGSTGYTGSMYFGPDSSLTVAEGETLTLRLACGYGSVVFDAGASGSDLAGLGRTKIIYEVHDGTNSNSIEAAGANEGASIDAFDADHFLIGELVVGSSSATGPVTLSVLDAQNTTNPHEDQVVYVDVLNIQPHANFQFTATTAIYFLRTDANQTANPRRLFAGDCDLNGHVSFSDYITLANNMGQTTGMTWAQGDFNGDGKVSFADYIQLMNNFGQ